MVKSSVGVNRQARSRLNGADSAWSAFGRSLALILRPPTTKPWVSYWTTWRLLGSLATTVLSIDRDPPVTARPLPLPTTTAPCSVSVAAGRSSPMISLLVTGPVAAVGPARNSRGPVASVSPPSSWTLSPVCVTSMKTWPALSPRISLTEPAALCSTQVLPFQ